MKSNLPKSLSYGQRSSANRFVASVLSVCVLAPFSAQADIVVTPNDRPQPVEDVNAQVEIITRDEIEQIGAADIAELINTRTGVDLGRNGGNGQLSSVFIRGANSNHTLILVNGVNIAPDIGQAPIQNINLDTVERIEIVKSGASVVYGSNAIGGVINIITRKGDDEKALSGGVSLAAGSYDTRKYSARVHGHYQGFFAGLNVAKQSVVGPSAQEKPEDEDAFDNQAINAYAGFENEHFATGVNVTTADGNVEYDSFGSDGEQDFANQSGRVYAKVRNDVLEGELYLSQAKDELEQKKKNYLGQYDFANTTRSTTGAKVTYTPKGMGMRYTLGAEVANIDSDVSSFGKKYDESYKDKSIFGQYAVARRGHHFELGARRTESGKNDAHTVGNVQYGYDINPYLTAFMGGHTAYRNPSLSERFGFSGKKDLKPEKSKNTELGIKFARDGHLVKVTTFRTTFTDLISYGPTFSLDNIAKAKNRGTEVNYSFVGDQWRYHVGVTHQRPKNEDTGVDLARRASLALNAGVYYQTKLWGAGANLTQVGSRKNSDFDQIMLDRYTLLDVSASYFPMDNLTLRATVKNVADVNYETAKGYNSPGVNYLISADYKF